MARRAFVLAVVCAALALACGGAAGAFARPGAGDVPVALFHRDALAYGGESFPDVPKEAARYRLFIAQGYHSDLIPQFEAANPAIGAYLYKEAAFSESTNDELGTDPRNPGGVGYDEAQPHPDWFLLDRSGRRIRSSGFSGYVLMDVGNRGYQNRWAANVIAQAQRDGWTGVFADDLSLDLYGVTARPARYPDAASWQAAVRSFLANVGPQLRAHGLKLIVNVSSGVTWPQVRTQWLQYVDGTMEEGWMRPTVDPGAPLSRSSDDFAALLAEEAASEAHGKLFLAELPARASDVRGIRYGLAAFLLVAGGWASFDASGSPPYTKPVWNADLRTASALGAPVAAYRILGDGVYRRDFRNGTVLVNPTSHARVERLGGTYSGSGLTAVTAVYLRPVTAVVMVKGDSAPQPSAFRRARR